MSACRADDLQWKCAGGPDGENHSRLQGRQRQPAEVLAAARRGLRLSRRRGRRAALPRLAGLHVLRARPVRPPLQGDDPAPDDGDGRGRDHARRRRPSRRGDPQPEGARQAEADRRRHDRAGRDARRGLRRRARRHQGAPGRGARRNRDRARPDARFRRRDRGGLVEGGRRDDRVDRPAGSPRAPQRAAGQHPAGLASDRRRHRAHPLAGRGFRPRAGDLPRYLRRARRHGAGELGSRRPTAERRSTTSARSATRRSRSPSASRCGRRPSASRS